MNKTVTTIIVIILLIVGGVFLFGGSQGDQTTQQPDQSTSTQSATTSGSDAKAASSTATSSSQMESSTSEDSTESGDSTSTSSTQQETGAESANTNQPAATVTYQSGQFQPQTVTINKGETVRFVSEGGDMWVGSDRHPTHTQYDGTNLKEHCNGGQKGFDQCGTGQTYSFTFNKTGEFGYHNHERPSAGGTVIVQ